MERIKNFFVSQAFWIVVVGLIGTFTFDCYRDIKTSLSKITVLEKDVQYLKSDVSALKSDVSTLKSDVREIIKSILLNKKFSQR